MTPEERARQWLGTRSTYQPWIEQETPLLAEAIAAAVAEEREAIDALFDEMGFHMSWQSTDPGQIINPFVPKSLQGDAMTTTDRAVQIMGYIAALLSSAVAEEQNKCIDDVDAEGKDCGCSARIEARIRARQGQR